MRFGDQAVAVENGDFTTALRAVPAPDFVILGLCPLHLPERLDPYHDRLLWFFGREAPPTGQRPADVTDEP